MIERIFIGILLLTSLATTAFPKPNTTSASVSESKIELIQNRWKRIDARLAIALIDVSKHKKALPVFKDVSKELGQGNVESSSLDELFVLINRSGHKIVDDKNSVNEGVIKLLGRIDKQLSAIANDKSVELYFQQKGTSAAKGALAGFRYAIGQYYADNNGDFPIDPQDLIPKYLSSFSKIKTFGHSQVTDNVKIISGINTNEALYSKVDDSGGWLYVGDRNSKLWGTLVINCSHKDDKGVELYKAGN
ncbi:MAG TPA: hypothetical protein PKI19_12075 [Elusimicrobiales bacterium]|nr:hypothetical protein [Elusimicrobiales bacterium]